MLFKLVCMYWHRDVAFIECLLHARPSVFTKLTEKLRLLFFLGTFIIKKKDSTILFIKKKK